MASDLREAVARAIAPIAWLEYGDRSHRDHTLVQADAAIAAVLEHLIAEAEPIDLADDEAGWHSVADWLRSFREAGQ